MTWFKSPKSLFLLTFHIASLHKEAILRRTERTVEFSCTGAGVLAHLFGPTPSHYAFWFGLDAARYVHLSQAVPWQQRFVNGNRCATAVVICSPFSRVGSAVYGTMSFQCEAYVTAAGSFNPLVRECNKRHCVDRASSSAVYACFSISGVGMPHGGVHRVSHRAFLPNHWILQHLLF